tara:strand:- start:226 stop:549 length:324 start_codon:yes stop_codon:yes gene_type:complete
MYNGAMTKTISLDELIINDRWYHAEVEVYIDTLREEWEILELTEWADEGNREIVIDVKNIEPEMEKTIIEIAQAQLVDGEGYPTDRELDEEAREGHLLQQLDIERGK